MRILGIAWVAGALAGLATAPRLARAQETPASSAAIGWYTGVASGWYFPIQHWPTAYVLGGGGTYFTGRQVSSTVGVELDVNMWLLSGSERSTWDMKSGPIVRWTPRPGRVALFGLTGLGVDLQTNYPARATNVAPMLPLGLGVQAVVTGRSDCFVEAMHYVVFRSVATRDIPVLAGFRLGF
jgi:hypothetical protein